MPIHPKLGEPAKKQVEMDQPCCMFIPHALAMRQGQELVVKNSALFAHNTNWQSLNVGGNVLIPAGGKIVIENLKAARYPIKVACNIHSWMGAWVRVFDHPYYAITDENGNFEIKDAPSGDYHLVVWQETVGYVSKGGKNGEPIAIKANGVTDAGEFKVNPK